MSLRPATRSAHARNVGALFSRALYRVEVYGAHHVGLDKSLIVLASGVGASGLLMIKSVLRRPAHMLIPQLTTTISGDIPIELPYAIDGQLLALQALQQGAAIGLDTEIIEPGFLVNASEATVIPVSMWWENKLTRECEPWDGKPPSLRTQVHVYFGHGEKHDAVNPPASGISRTNQFATEWCRQVLQDHQEMVLHRLGGRAAQ